MGTRTEKKAYSLVRRGNRKRLRTILRKHRYLLQSHRAMLLFAALWHNRGMLDWLLERGVDPDCRMGDPHEDTPLMSAACSGDHRSLRLLLRHGADTSLVNESGENALGFAVTWEQAESIKVLVEAGVDVNDLSDSGPERTQLDCAEASGWKESVDCLRELGGKHFADLDWEDGWHAGDFAQVTLSNGLCAYLRLLRFPLIAVYELQAATAPSLDELKTQAVAFRIWIARSATGLCGWKKLGNLPVLEQDCELPVFYWRDAWTGDCYEYVAGREYRRLTAEDCVGLEAAVIWTQKEAESRIEDHFAGRKNPRHESLSIENQPAPLIKRKS